MEDLAALRLLNGASATEGDGDDASAGLEARVGSGAAVARRDEVRLGRAGGGGVMVELTCDAALSMASVLGDCASESSLMGPCARREAFVESGAALTGVLGAVTFFNVDKNVGSFDMKW